MCTDRRDFLRLSAGIPVTNLIGTPTAHGQTEPQPPTQHSATPEAITRRHRMTDAVKPITLDERKARNEKARRLMKENRIDAIYLEPGTTMSHFAGMRW